MFKKFLLVSMYLSDSFTYAQNCFTNIEVTNSNKLFSYKGDVYDISNYNHPKKVNIDKLIGNDLSEFVNSNKLSFHFNKDRFYSDLENMLVGQICDIPTTQITTKPETTKITTSIVETTSSVTTNNPETTSSNAETTSSVTTNNAETTSSVTTNNAETTTSEEQIFTEENPFIGESIINKPNIILILSTMFIILALN